MIVAATLGEAARAVETVAHSKGNHGKPEISYSVAMGSWFVYDGHVYQVKSAPADVFLAWLTSVTPASWTEYERAEYIALDESGSAGGRALGRWYSLCNIKGRNKSRAVVYGSEQEALARLKAR